MRVAIYARVSPLNPKKQDPENQLLRLREFAERQGWTIAIEYVERGSGGNGDREQFRAMFDAASRREFDLVLFWALDRFSREGSRETLNYLEQLTAWGVGWRSYMEQYIDSTGLFREAVIAILAALAKQERVRLGERMRASVEKRRKENERLGRDINYRIGGWRVEQDDLKLERRVGELKQQGMSLRKMQAALGERQLDNGRLVKFSLHTLQRLAKSA